MPAPGACGDGGSEDGRIGMFADSLVSGVFVDDDLFGRPVKTRVRSTGCEFLGKNLQPAGVRPEVVFTGDVVAPVVIAVPVVLHAAGHSCVPGRSFDARKQVLLFCFGQETGDAV